MIRVNKNQGTNIMMDMLEQVGAVELLNEMISQMSSDELSEVVGGLDQYVFDNHYSGILDEDDEAFDDQTLVN